MKSIKSAARKHGRIVSLLLLSVLFLTSWCVEAAHADGVKATISNGQTVSGTLTGKGSDTYTFKVTAGSAFVLSVSETGTHVPRFVPEIDLGAPGGVDGPGLGHPFHTLLEETDPAEGTWSVKVHNADTGTTAASYKLTLIQVPGTLPPSGGIAGGAMSPGAANPGSSVRGAVDVWTFNGVVGQTQTLTLNQTGGTGFFPIVDVFTPTGGFGGGFGCARSCSNDIPITADGVYTVMAWRLDGNDVTGTYTLSVNNKN